jgi:hypothetical protein
MFGHLKGTYVLCDLYIMLQAFREFVVPPSTFPKKSRQCSTQDAHQMRVSGSLNQNPKIIDIFSYDSYIEASFQWK